MEKLNVSSILLQIYPRYKPSTFPKNTLIEL